MNENELVVFGGAIFFIIIFYIALRRINYVKQTYYLTRQERIDKAKKFCLDRGEIYVSANTDSPRTRLVSKTKEGEYNNYLLSALKEGVEDEGTIFD